MFVSNKNKFKKWKSFKKITTSLKKNVYWIHYFCKKKKKKKKIKSSVLKTIFRLKLYFQNMT